MIFLILILFYLFIFWPFAAGVAAHLSRNGAPLSVSGGAPPSGKAFCFLPLPCGTGMPVHVNGYFELSSNRRDIWFGQDMAGGECFEWTPPAAFHTLQHPITCFSQRVGGGVSGTVFC